MAGGVPALHPERRGMLNWSPKKNQIEKRGGLPIYFNSVATALMRTGMSREKAIATAVNFHRGICRTGRVQNLPKKPKVSAAVRAASCAAVADWDARIKGPGRK